MISCGKSEINEVGATIEEDVSRTIISGEFTVGVRDVIPDYCLDNVTPCVALVTEFQSYPFTIYVGEEIGAQLENETQYVFSIDPIEVNYSVEELQKMKHGSIAKIDQITTVSKIRIFNTKNNILLGITATDRTLDLIDSKIKKLYTK